MPRADGEAAIRLGKPLVFLLCLAPLLVRAWRIGSNDLGPNPVEAVLHFTGLWALRMLLVTLALTPLRRLTGLPWLLRFRRMLGLFAFFYVVLHFVAYLVLDRALVWEEILRDLKERPYIAPGLPRPDPAAAPGDYLHLGLDAPTGRRWKQLRRVVYGVAVTGVVHFPWLVKADLQEPLIYGLLLGGLLAALLPWARLARGGVAVGSASRLVRR